MDHVRLARKAIHGPGPQRAHIRTHIRMRRARLFPKRRTPPAEQRATDTFAAQTFEQTQDLPLATAHFASGIQVENMHDPLAPKPAIQSCCAPWRTSKTCRGPPYRRW